MMQHQDGFAAGDMVVVKDLPTTCLNGMQGTLIAYSDTTGRWDVRIKNIDHLFFLKAGNLAHVPVKSSKVTSGQNSAGAAAEAKKKQKEARKAEAVAAIEKRKLKAARKRERNGLQPPQPTKKQGPAHKAECAPVISKKNKGTLKQPPAAGAAPAK
jgi:hypothetical protein